METLRDEIISASISHFESMIKRHKINVENLLVNTVGVAEHPDIMETVEKELSIIAEYDDKLSVLKKYFN